MKTVTRPRGAVLIRDSGRGAGGVGAPARGGAGGGTRAPGAGSPRAPAVFSQPRPLARKISHTLLFERKSPNTEGGRNWVPPLRIYIICDFSTSEICLLSSHLLFIDSFTTIMSRVFSHFIF